MAQKQRIFSRANTLVTTALDKTDSVVYETLTTVEMTSKSLTNTVEEFHNDTIQDLIESRLTTMDKLAKAKQSLKDLGYSDEEIASTLSFARR